MAAASHLPDSSTNHPEKGPEPGPVRHNQIGYKLEIFQTEHREKFSCGYCDKILRDPVQSSKCGHKFCNGCKTAIEESTKAGSSVVCKKCKDEGMTDEESVLDPAQMFPDKGIRREMGTILAKCPNALCVYSRPFRDYVKHEEECKFRPIVCEKCGEVATRLKMDQHMSKECPRRIVVCEHCDAEMVYAQKASHLKECSKVPESCGLCSKQVPREKMSRHQKRECSNRTVTCPMEGCGLELRYSLFHQHVQKDLARHLSWVLSHIENLDNLLTELMESESQAGSSADAQGLSVETLKCQLDQLEQLLQESVGQASVAVGGAAGGSGHGSGGAEASASTAGGSRSIMERLDAMMVKVNSLEPILSVLHGEISRCITTTEVLQSKQQAECVKITEAERKIEQYETTVNTTLSSIARCETHLSTGIQDTADGTLLWKIQNFSKARQDAVAGNVTFIQSRPFYTGSIGYKMVVCLYPNGDGTGLGSHLSLFFCILRSSHDAILPWPFQQKVYFMLIDQNFKKHIVDAFKCVPSSPCSRQPVSDRNTPIGCPLFVPLDKLHQADVAYIKDDTMYIRVVVDTQGLHDHIKQFDPRNTPHPRASCR